MTLTITPLYLAAIAILMAGLSIAVGLQRAKHSVALGAGGVAPLFLAQRRFGNLTEYAPMILLLMAVMEMRGFSAPWLHAYGGTFLVLRVLHPIALNDAMEAPLWRKLGRGIAAAGTALLLVIGAIVAILN